MTAQNLLIIVADEHNPFISGFAGDSYVSTPNLDKLAAGGTQFSTAYCNSPICVPARASLATGLYVHQNEYWDNAIGYDGEKKSWTHVLQDNGIRVESIGKLHYKGGGINSGFDQEHLPMHIKGAGMLWGLLRDPLNEFKNQAAGMLRPIGQGHSPYNQYDEDITAKTCQWLQEVSHSETKSDKLWVLFVGLVAPHFPLTVPEEFIQPYLEMNLPEPRLRPENGYARHPWLEDMARSQPVDESLSDEERKLAVASYYGLVSFMDHKVGQILDQLEATGLSQNTRVLYTSDHGDNTGARGLWGKCTMNDESAGIPMILSGSDIPAGKTVNTPVSLVDLYPTVLDATDVEFSEPDCLDRSYTRSLLQLAQQDDDGERIILSEYHAVGSRSAAYLLRNRNYKYIHYLDYPPELFYMKSDPLEKNNLAQAPEYTELVKNFEAKLREILNPEEIDAKAKTAQAILIEKHGGWEACLSGGPQGATPVPKLEPHEQ